MSDDWRRRVDPQLGASYDRAREEGRLWDEVAVLALLAARHDRVEGLSLGNRAGDIATATLVLVDLPRIAGDASVLYLSAAEQLGWDCTGPGPG